MGPSNWKIIPLSAFICLCLSTAVVNGQANATDCLIGPEVFNTTEYLPYQICTTPRTDVRLCNGSHAAEGRVQIQHPTTGEWGEICDDFFFLAEARMIMEMMCFDPQFAHAHPGNSFGEATVGIAVHQIHCNPADSDIFDCFNIGNWGIHPCAPQEAAAASLCVPPCDDTEVPIPEVECPPSEKIVAIFNRDWDPTLEPAHFSIYSANATCGFWTWQNTTHLYFHIPIWSCNTQRTTNATHIKYNNTIIYSVSPDPGIIRGGHQAHIHVICVFPRLGNESLGPIAPVDPTLPPIVGVGEFQLKFRLFEQCLPNGTFINPVTTFPYMITLGQRLYFLMTLVTQDSLRLNVPRCWTTPTIDPYVPPRFDLFENNCRSEPSIIFYSNSLLEMGFSFEAFRFVGANPFIYVHCYTWVCPYDQRGGMCDRHCAGRRKLLSWGVRRAQADEYNTDMEAGPVFFAEYPPTDDDLRDAPIATDPPPFKPGNPTSPLTTTTTLNPATTTKSATTTTTEKPVSSTDPQLGPVEDDDPGYNKGSTLQSLEVLSLVIIVCAFYQQF